jgi:hypothetical protein
MAKTIDRNPLKQGRVRYGDDGVAFVRSQTAK